MKLFLTAGKLKEVVGGRLTIDESVLIQNISSLEEAKAGDLAVIIDRGDRSVFDKVKREVVEKCNAELLLASRVVVEGKNYLLVDDVIEALQKIYDFIYETRSEQKGPLISKAAVVSPSAIIGKNVRIESGAVIGDNVVIGDGSYIGHNVVVKKKVNIGVNVKIYSGVSIWEGVVIGDNSTIYSGAVIGSVGFGFQVNLTGLRRIPHLGIVRIGRNVEIGSNAVVDRAVFDETVLDDGVKIDNFVYVSHNVKIGKFTAILGQTIIGGSVVIGMGCQIGGHVAIKDHIKIGNFVKIVSKSAVMKNIKDGETIAGIPAVKFSHWKRIAVISGQLPTFWNFFNKLKSTLGDKDKKGSFTTKSIWGLLRL